MEREGGRRGRKEEKEREGRPEEYKDGGKEGKEIKRVTRRQGPRFTKSLSMICRLGQHFKAGMMAGVLTTVIMAPGERIKCLMQVRVKA